MSEIRVILNPLAGRGYAGRVADEISHAFRALGADYEMVYTTAHGEAIDLARRAMDDGVKTVVAVGGDGTSHEVMNGMIAASSDGEVVGIMGCIPAGSGNDFAVSSGAPEQIEAACRMIVEGRTRCVDVGHLNIDGTVSRYFDNTLGIGFDGLVTIEAKKFKRARGMALYVPVVLKTIFVDIRPPMVEIEYDGQALRQRILMVVVSNGPREGGSFYVAPDAKTDDGLFDLVVTESMSRLAMLGIVPKFMNGSHVQTSHVTLKRAKHIVISSDENLWLHADGEILCGAAHRIECNLYPGRLRVIAPPSGAPASSVEA